ncbi:hypothetical protein J4433_03125 [Candidatus Pacearchaeota archaeon]|nr:hypothetical protein [Candidatus Pacearchaeota archaeon]
MGKDLGERVKLPSFKNNILLDIAQINPKNKKKINEYAQDTIEYANRLENAPRPAILRVNKELR